MVEVPPWSFNVVVCRIGSFAYWWSIVFQRALIHGVFTIMGSASHLGYNGLDDWSGDVVVTAIH